MTEFLIGELRKAVRSSDRKPLIVCGAGVSIQATDRKAPSWASLIRSGIKHAEALDLTAGAWAIESRQKLASGGTDAWIAVANEVTERLGGARNAEFATWLEGEVGHLVLARRDLLDAVIALGCPIATTNYDDVLDKLAGLPPISWSDYDETFRFLRDPTPQGILHLHGHWRSPEEVVLGSKSYGEHSSDDRRALLQQMAALDRQTVFIGCSQDGLDDPDFKRLDSFLSEWQDVAQRRYWLIRQEIDEHGNPKEPPPPDHPRRLFPVVFGKSHDDLLPLLRGLLEPIGATVIDLDAAIHCIDHYEPKPELFGREGEIKLVVDALLAGKSAIIAGGPGMGKTTVAIAALYDRSVITKFGRRRVFAPLETATEPRSILAKLVETLGLLPTGDEVSLLRMLETSAAEQPIAAILDNAETVFEINRGETERLLNLVAQIDGISLAVTIRGAAPHVFTAVSIDDIPKLHPAAARSAFVAIAGLSSQADADLPYLLEALDGHALSISLVAAQASGLPTLRGLRELWDEAHADILRRPGERESRLNSVRASLALSLGSRRMNSTPLARRLLALLALLPGGLAEKDVPLLLGERATVTRAKANDASACLHQLRLVERRPDRRLRMLTPLRECARQDVPGIPADRKRLIDQYLAIAGKAYKIGSGEWDNVREEVEAEVDNLDPICSLAVGAGFSSGVVDSALAGLAKFHQFCAKAAVNSLTSAVARLSGKPARRASVIFDLGRIALARSDYETGVARLDEALVLYQRIGDVLGEANCISNLGTFALRRSDNETAAIRFNAALVLHRRVGDVLGEANCIRSLGDIARQRSAYETAAARFDEALVLNRRLGNVVGEANCIFSLGDIAFLRSDHETAALRFDEALVHYRRIGHVLGEANCINSLGDIAFRRSDHETAAARFDAALVLYRRIGSVIGEANSIRSHGDIALQRSDHAMAVARFDEALVLFRRIGHVLGEANCIRSLGDIALQLSDYETAAARFGEALVLHRKSGSQHGIAEAMIRLGQAKCSAGEVLRGRADIEAGCAVYFKIADIHDRAFPGWQALHRALVCEDAVKAACDGALVRQAWTSIGRLDLVHAWLEPPP